VKTTNITYVDKDGKGNLTLYKNKFENGSEYYARFDRETVTVDHMIARMQKKDVGINAIVAKHILSLYKAEVIEAATQAESVNLFDLGTLYLAASGVKGTTNETATIEKIMVRFTASKELNDAVKKVEIRKITWADSSPKVELLTDLFSQKTDGTATCGKVLRLEGSKLKMAGDECGVFFAQCEDDGAYPKDEASWIKSPVITRNTHKNLEFFIPESLEAGKKYLIFHKSGILQKDKSYTYSTNELCKVNMA